jgi:predicted hydrocarbon binding protein
LRKIRPSRAGKIKERSGEMNFNRNIAEVILFAYFCAEKGESIPNCHAVANLIAGLLEKIYKKNEGQEC